MFYMKTYEVGKDENVSKSDIVILMDDLDWKK